MAWPTKKSTKKKCDKLSPALKWRPNPKAVIAPKRADGTLGPRSITRVRVKDVLVGDGSRKRSRASADDGGIDGHTRKVYRELGVVNSWKKSLKMMFLSNCFCLITESYFQAGN